MFCPRCRSEYRNGFFTCADCDIALVDALPPEPEPEFVDFTEVLATYNPADIAFIKSILGAERIEHFFKGEHFLYMRPLVDPARLMVRADQVELARDVLKDLDVAFLGINLPKESTEENHDT